MKNDSMILGGTLQISWPTFVSSHSKASPEVDRTGSIPPQSACSGDESEYDKDAREHGQFVRTNIADSK